MKTIVNILLYIWQLPQNLLGLVVRAYYRRVSKNYEEFYLNDAVLSVASGMMGGISLGKYIIVRDVTFDGNIVNHEYGHCKQSKYLGWLYLPTVGVCSILWKVSNRYVVVFDPQKGISEKADHGVITVFDRYWMAYGGKPEIVAEWRGQIDKDITIR